MHGKAGMHPVLEQQEPCMGTVEGTLCWSRRSYAWEGWNAPCTEEQAAPGEAVEMLRRGCPFADVQFCQKLLEVSEHRIRNPGLSKESPFLVFFFFHLYKSRKEARGHSSNQLLQGQANSWRLTLTFSMEQATSLLESHKTLAQESGEHFLCPFPNKSLLLSVLALILGRHTLLQTQGVSKL